jgi:prepilin-type N-terminal cleavage/methylation domain-containing protein
MGNRYVKAFTLMELLLVVVLLGVLAVVVIPRLANTGSDSKANTCRQNVAIINSQIELWAARNGSQYPETHEEFVEKILKHPDVFPNGAPRCPYGIAYTYDPAKNRVVGHKHPKFGVAEVTPEEIEVGEIVP